MTLLKLAKPLLAGALKHSLSVNMVLDLREIEFEGSRRNQGDDSLSFDEWIALGLHSKMSFLERNMPVRQNPKLILNDAKSAIMFAIPYALGKHTRGSLSPNLVANKTEVLIAKYARGLDYHKVIKRKIDAFAAEYFTGRGVSHRSVVDSVPFLERAHARMSGLGFVGKNTMLIRPGMGSYFFIATLLLDCEISSIADAAPNNAITDLDCGSCRLCLDGCPTGALNEKYQLDANKCLSYLTIENRELVPNEFVPDFKDTIFGCDICQDVCPYNLKTSMQEIWPELKQTMAQRNGVSVLDIAKMSFVEYQSWFGGSAMTRAKYAGLVRNAMYHLHAIDHPAIQDILVTRHSDSEALIAKTVGHIQSLRSGD